MATTRTRPVERLRCTFCNKSQDEVKKLIAGPTVYICDECVDICVDIIEEDEPERKRRRPPNDDEIVAISEKKRLTMETIFAALRERAENLDQLSYAEFRAVLEAYFLPLIREDLENQLRATDSKMADAVLEIERKQRELEAAVAAKRKLASTKEYVGTHLQTIVSRLATLTPSS